MLVSLLTLLLRGLGDLLNSVEPAHSVPSVSSAEGGVVEPETCGIGVEGASTLCDVSSWFVEGEELKTAIPGTTFALRGLRGAVTFFDDAGLCCKSSSSSAPNLISS